MATMKVTGKDTAAKVFYENFAPFWKKIDLNPALLREIITQNSNVYGEAFGIISQAKSLLQKNIEEYEAKLKSDLSEKDRADIEKKLKAVISILELLKDFG